MKLIVPVFTVLVEHGQIGMSWSWVIPQLIIMPVYVSLILENKSERRAVCEPIPASSYYFY